MTKAFDANPYDSPQMPAAARPAAQTPSTTSANWILETVVATGAVAMLAMFVMSAVRGGPRADLPTLHSACSYIVRFRMAATGPGAAIGWFMALVVICLPGILTHVALSLLARWFGWFRKPLARLDLAQRCVFWLSISYATGWLICLVV